MQYENVDGPSLILRTVGYSVVIVRPGQSVKIGRDKHNDLVLCDPTVSRLHATITWDDKTSYPRIVDNKSTAGTKVDGRLVTFRHLATMHTISLGSTSISAEYAHSEAAVPTQTQLPLLPPESAAAILLSSSEDNKVTLFKEYGSTDESGHLSTNESIHKLLKSLELRRRTGTLYLSGDFDAWVIYAIGKIKQASCGSYLGEWALQTIAGLPNAKYMFTVECDVGEAPLNISATCYLRALRLSSTRRRNGKRGRECLKDQ